MSVSSGTGSASSPLGNEEHRISCITCKRRKVKCDKNSPCASCARRNIDCIYVTATGKRKTRGPGKHRAGERIEQMTTRVAQLEQVLGQLKARGGTGEDPVHGNDNFKASPDSAPVSEQRPQERDNGLTMMDSIPTPQDEERNHVDQSASRLLVKEGKSEYIRNKFWAGLNDELGDSEDVPGEEAYATPSQSHHQEPSPVIPSSHSLLFGSLGGSLNLEMLRPPAFQIPLYWQLYVDNVDAIYKFLHVPSMASLISTASSSDATLSPGNEALLFGICFAAITSMSVKKVQTTFQDNKAHLLSRYRCGLEQALGRARLLSTRELSTLQAFVLLIICSRQEEDSRTIWVLVGLAARLAIGMGLQHDGAKFNLSPLETEMRRRLWWNIYLLDVRAAEEQGCEVTIAEDAFDTKKPLNINDEDLDVNATVFPTPRIGLTEMTLCLLRLDIIATGRTILTVDYGLAPRPQNQSLREKVEAIKACERRIHQKCLQYCRPEVPIAVFMYTMAKHCVAKMSLMAHQPDYRVRRDDQVPSTLTKPELSRDELFVMSMSILEGSQFIETTPALEQWAWVSRKYVQWHAIAYILTELSSPSRQPGPLVDRAWRVIDGFGRGALGQVTDTTTTPIVRPVEKLMAKARRRRAETTTTQSPPEAQNDFSRLAEFEQWNLQQVQDIGPTTENFDWFLGAPQGAPQCEGEPPAVSNMADNNGGGGYIQQLETPMSLPIQDVEFWNDMTGLLQYQPGDNNGAICGGEMSDWW